MLDIQIKTLKNLSTKLSHLTGAHMPLLRKMLTELIQSKEIS